MKKRHISIGHLLITVMAALASWFWGFAILVGLCGDVVHEAFGTPAMSPIVVIPGIVGSSLLSLLAVLHFGRNIR